MKVEQIKDTIDNLINNDKVSAILLDGAWGIGKTYEVLNYLKTLKKYRCAYVSLFGKKDINEINTELYRELNPQAKVLETISKVVSIASTSVSISSDVGINLNGTVIGGKKTIKNKKGRVTVVVIDDFERQDDTIKPNDLLGYFNQLLLQGVKIIVLSNLEKDLNEKLGEYKEKVFDRIYTIDGTRIEVAKRLVDGMVEIKESHLEMVDQNLRMVIKANSLFLQIKNRLKEKIGEFNQGVLFFYCLYVVKETLSKKFTEEYIQSLKDNSYQKYFIEDPNLARNIAFSNVYKAEFGVSPQSSLLNAIFKIFEQENYIFIDNLFDGAKEKEDVFKGNIYYLSDENKIKKIHKQYTYIISTTDARDKEKVLDAISSWYNDCGFLNKSFIEEGNLFEKLYQLGVVVSEDGWHYEGAMREFLDRYQSFCLQKKQIEIEEKMSICDTAEELLERFEQIFREYSSYSTELKEVVKNELIKNNFYITQIHSDMTKADWTLAHKVCKFISSDIYELVPKLFKYLNKYKEHYPDDKSLNYRVEQLIKQYSLQPQE